MITLTWLELSLSSVLILILAALNFKLKLGQVKSLLVSTLRMFIQLFIVGIILKTLFSYQSIFLLIGLALAMLLIAGFEVLARQKIRFTGNWGFGLGTSSMFISSVALAFFALIVVIRVDPWFTPQYAIPLLGMLLGNTMNGVSLALGRLTDDAWHQKREIEAQLMLGRTARESILSIEKNCLRTALTPTINAMAVSGIVSLPGMMTGQILAGADPLEAVKYQILIMLLIAAGVGFGSLIAVWFGAKRLFDDRERLRLDRLQVTG